MPGTRLISDIGGLPAGEVPRGEVPQLPWEQRLMATFSLLMAGKKLFNLDEFRRVVEEMPPAEYAASSFYGRRLDGLAALLAEKGLIDAADLARRTHAILHDHPHA